MLEIEGHDGAAAGVRDEAHGGLVGAAALQDSAVIRTIKGRVATEFFGAAGQERQQECGVHRLVIQVSTER